MDVRCEKCLTIYEFDDAQVGPAGVTVKCTQCGNLFKVKRRDTAEIQLGQAATRSPAYIPPAPAYIPPSNTPSRPAPNRTTHAGIPVLPLPPVAQTPSSQAATIIPPPEPMWMVRLKSNGEVYRFREMTTLQQWIVERKVARRDEISRTGDTWKVLGSITELEPFFQIVDQAQQPQQGRNAMVAAVEELALTTTAPMATPPPARREEPRREEPRREEPRREEPRFSGPTAMGRAPVGDDPAFATTGKQPRVSPEQFGMPAVVDELAELDLPPMKKRWPIYIGGLLIILAGAGITMIVEREAIKQWFAPANPKALPAYTAARDEFLSDTDDGFRHAAQQLEQAHGADAQNALVLAALAETRATFAWYLREDARALDGGGPVTEAAARTLRKEAQSHVDEAKKAATDALALAPDSPEVSRAMADYQRVDGAPAAEVERYLKRALDKQPGDAESVYIAGALLLRENKPEEARVKLEQANQLAAGTAQHGLLRAQFLLAKIAIAGGKRDEAKKWLQSILQSSPQHERAHVLLATVEAVDAGVAKSSPDMAAVKVGANPPQPAPGDSGKTPQPPGSSKDTPDAALGYDKLVERADHLSENGRPDNARKFYEKALELKPNGVEAITGLGYCDLDKERFMSAMDNFKRALAISSSYGEAIIGLAEAYKVRGDKSHAAEFYKRYLKTQPGGPKAAMAQKNLHDLEPPAPSATENLPKTPSDDNAEKPRAPDEPPP
ncbi:MAG TPA: tetratricopeptide repeat protein [Polyangia bacterium]|nr:tetratricopeptide repeat protein [Polyangia bacterium]